MIRPSPKILFLTLSLLALPIFAWLFWSWSTTPPTLDTVLAPTHQTGEQVKQDFQSLPTFPLSETDQSYTIQDSKTDGIDITFASDSEELKQSKEDDKQNGLKLSFPKNYAEPLTVKLDEKRTIEITDLAGTRDYTATTMAGDIPTTEPSFPLGGETSKWSAVTQLFEKKPDSPQTYLHYQSQDERKSLLYAYQKDQATGERKLKHWTLYQEGTGLEQESYQFKNAKLRLNEQGEAEVFYYDDQSLKNDQAAAEVDANLLERAQRTLAKEMGDDLMSGSHTPDFTIPKPYYLDNQGEKHEAEWKWNAESSTLSVSFTPESYPIALDPTLAFTVPGTSTGGDTITGEVGSLFGSSLATGDWNNDGKTDLALGANGYSSSTGRVYLFYSDGGIATTATTADVIITGEGANDNFGVAMTAGDFNNDGKTDLVVGAYGYSLGIGRVYLFYNDGSIPATATTADVIITGEILYNNFGGSMVSGDFNTNGKTDLAVGAFGYSTNTGRAYIFYNDGSIPTTAATADVIITGQATYDYFSQSFAAGDWNADGKTDLAIGGFGYSSDTGRAYIFYNGSIITEGAAGADVIITGVEGRFGQSLIGGDFNADGRVDLAVGASAADNWAGRVYIFYNDGSIPTTAATADSMITGAGSYFGNTGSLAVADWNSDGRIDLAIGAPNTGKVYLFYNDGSIPTTAATADVIITGEDVNFAYPITGDFNQDGKTDLVVGAPSYASSRGKVYIFYSQNGQVNTNQSISTGGGTVMTSDWNADGRTDLAVGLGSYSTNTGRVYLFYGDGQIPSTAATADVIITGETTSNYFGQSLTAGDFNADGKIDLAVGAFGYSTSTGRAYIFYNDGSIPTTAATADIIITGGAFSYTGSNLAAGDLNADGKTDLVASGSNWDSTAAGKVYIFYSGSIITENVSGADVTIVRGSGGGSYSFGSGLAIGDIDVDGDQDLVVSNLGGGGGSEGAVYVFYNDGSYPSDTNSANIVISGVTGYALFGSSLVLGDINSDGRTDIIAGESGYSTNTGRTYIFYNDGSFPGSAGSADVTLTGEATNNYFGSTLATGDWNADGRTDLAVGAYGYSSSTGRVYLFYNDGSIPTTAATADTIITGASSESLGTSLIGGDMNGDGRVDLVVGTADKIYLYETRGNYAWKLQPVLSGTLRTGTNTTGQELRITGETGSYFGYAMTTGDFNADGRTDLAVGAYQYSSSTGRTYIFYNDGSLTVGASSADVIIVGEATADQFGISLAAGDFNADGRIDLAVGATLYSGNNNGRAYLFYNGSIVSENASGADIIITGETTSNFLGGSLASGDFNADGKSDLAVGAYFYSTGTGRVYIFYNGSIITENASGADIILTGETFANYFGYSLTSGDFNADGRTDLAVGAIQYSSITGRAYIFYNDGSIPTTAATADVTITGEASSNFGTSLTSGDWNGDGRTDLAVGAPIYSSSTGRTYIFYNGSIITENASGADVIITGEASSSFGLALTAGDLNSDGRTDLVVSAYGYSSFTGRAYIFYNDGSIPTTAATADVILTGEASSDFGSSLTSGDFNSDGRTDLAVGANDYSSSKGRVYLYTLGHDAVITGEATTNSFGISLTSGDWNSDGRTDLAVGAYAYSSSTGRVYLFYNDGSIPTTAATADVIITGGATSDNFGTSLTSGDWNADGRIDLAVGAQGYSSYTGRVYLFYNDGSIPTTAATADIIITGEATNNFAGYALTAGDFNADGKTDLVAGTPGYSTTTGRTYIFYSGNIITENASGADVIITGGGVFNAFGASLIPGDFNFDGRTDLAVGASSYSSDTGRAYIFYNDGSIPTTAATADVIITGGATSNLFGFSLTSGDFNFDGRIDLAVGAYTYTTSIGRAYIFYNDGSIPTTAATADVTITGEASSNFGTSLTSGDWNGDGRTDLAVGAPSYSSSTGRAYIFYNDGSIPTTAVTADVILTGEATSSLFGYYSLTAGDFNADGKTDLAVGAYGFDNGTSDWGRVYLIISETTQAQTPYGQARQKGVGKLKGSAKLK